MLTQEQVALYRQEGYVYAAGVLPEEMLRLAQGILEGWVERTVRGWVEQGVLEDEGADLGFKQRLAVLWEKAGRPQYSRSPRRDIVGPEMYELLVHPALLDLAAALLGTDEISVHGVFNARPKLPDQRWTDTPWHQDAQYYHDAEKAHVLSIWFPLQKVTEENSCMQVAPRRHRGGLYADYHDEETGFKGISKEERHSLPGVSVEMERGDALCFGQLTPHRALANRSDQVRWSIDVRYEPTATATESGKEMGFVARSKVNPALVMSCEEWLSKWEGRPAGSY